MWFGYFYLFVFISGVPKKLNLIFSAPFLISLLLIFTTFVLGIWQIQRLNWKNELIKNFEDIRTASPINIENIDIKEFVKIKTEGVINRKNKIFFPAKTNNGKVGLRLASEITLKNGKKYLLDEGWFENSKFEYFKNNQDIFKESIEGYIRYPRNPKLFTPDNNLEKNEWYTYDLLSIKIFFSSPINNKFFIKKLNSNKEDFLIPASHIYQFRNNHLQYAITWFLMSFAFFILFLVYLKKNKNE